SCSSAATSKKVWIWDWPTRLANRLMICRLILSARHQAEGSALQELRQLLPQFLWTFTTGGWIEVAATSTTVTSWSSTRCGIYLWVVIAGSSQTHPASSTRSSAVGA